VPRGGGALPSAAVNSSLRITEPLAGPIVRRIEPSSSDVATTRPTSAAPVVFDA
jgi:hypothetical protein